MKLLLGIISLTSIFAEEKFEASMKDWVRHSRAIFPQNSHAHQTHQSLTHHGHQTQSLTHGNQAQRPNRGQQAQRLTHGQQAQRPAHGQQAQRLTHGQQTHGPTHGRQTADNSYGAPTEAPAVVDLHNQEFCVDVSTYQEVVWVQKPGEMCKTEFVKQCETKSENVCADITETSCEVSENFVAAMFSELYL